MSSGIYRTSTSSSTDWELPMSKDQETESEATSSSPLYQEVMAAEDDGFSLSRGEEDDKDEEDPLVGFQDEPEETKEETPKFALPSLSAPQKKKLTILGLIFLPIAFMLIVPSVILTVDRNQAESRLQAPGAVSVQELQVDISQPIPRVGLQLSIKKSAFPKYTTLNPNSVQCRFLNHDWGNTVVASIKEVEETDTTRGFVLNATLAPPENGSTIDPESTQHATMEDVTKAYATVAWQVLTQQTTRLGKYNCEIRMEATPFHRKAFTMQHIESVRGYLDLGSLWGTDYTKPKAPSSGPVLVASTTTPEGPKKDKHHYATTSWTPILIPDGDYHDGDDTVFGEENSTSTMAPTSAAHHTSTPTSAPMASSKEPSTEAPVLDIVSLPYHDKDAATDIHAYTSAPMVYAPPPPPPPAPTKKSFIVVHELSSEGLVLGVRLQLPRVVFDSVDNIQVVLPSIDVQIHSSAANPNAPPLVLSMENTNLDLDSRSNGQDYALARVGCGKEDASCPWYNPLLSLLTDTLQRSNHQNSIVTLSIDAQESFLEQMVGSVHRIVLFRHQMAHGFGVRSGRRNRRRNLQLGTVDCIVARDALFGDLFELNWCMNLRYSEGIEVDGSLNFYGYGGAVSTDLEWQETPEGVLRLDGSAVVNLQMSSDDQDTKMDLQGSAVLDPNDLSVAIHVNNTAAWWPFAMSLEASVEYDDPADAVIIKLENGKFVLDGEQYLSATGDIRVDNPDAKITMVVNDPRLDMAMDGAATGDGLKATWRVLYDEENLVTGDSSLVLPTANCDDDYYLNYYGNGILDLLNNPCSSNNGFQLKMESDGKLTTKVDAVLTSDYAKIRQGSISWDKEEIADVTMDLGWKIDYDDWEIEMELEEDTQDHRITFSLITKDSWPTFRADSQSSIRITGEKLFTSDLTYKENYEKETLEIDLSGEVRDQEYSMVVDIENNPSDNKEQFLIQEVSFLLGDKTLWKATGTLDLEQNDPYEDDYLRYKGTLALDGEVWDRTFDLDVDGDMGNSESLALQYLGSSTLSVDENLLWSEAAILAIRAFEEDETFRGTLELGSTSSQADVQMDANMECEWVGAKETFACQLSQMQLSYVESPLTDATGDMFLDLPGSRLSLDMRDDYEQDGDGYVVSMSGDFDSEEYILTGKINELKSYLGGEAIMDGAGEAILNIGDISVSYILEDIISETLMGLEHGGMTFTTDEYDESMETFDIRLDNMRMVMAGDPWVHGNMHFNLDTVQSTMSIAMDNNTTKLPMEFDFTIGFGDDDEMYMGLSVVSSPPPSPPTPPAVEDAVAPAAAPTVGEEDAAALSEEETPAVAPGDDFTSVTVNTTILIYNLEGLNATALLNDPETLAVLQEAFEDFVKDLLLSLEGQVSSVSVSKSQRSGRRFLEVALLDETAMVYGVVDVDCPADQPLPTPNATCQTISGGYELAVMDEDPDVVREKYVRETTQALEEGKLQESFKAIDPQFPVTVIGPVEDRKNKAETFIPILTQAPGPDESISAACHPGVGFALGAAIWTVGLLLEDL